MLDRSEPIYTPISLRQFRDKALASVPVEYLNILNTLAAARPRWTVEIAGNEVEVAFTAARPDLGKLDRICLLELEFGVVHIGHTNALVETLYAGRVDFRDADAGLHELLARHIFASPVSVDGTAVTEAVTLCSSAQFSADLISTPTIGFEVRLAEKEIWHSAFMRAEATVLNALFQALPDNPPIAKPLPATILLSVRSQDLLLPADDLANLARGDLIYLENTSPGALDRWLYLCGERQATLTPIDNLFRVNGFIGSRDTTTRTNKMDQAKAQSGADVQLPLSIEFGTKKMTAEEVCKLTDGSIIDFGPVSLDSVGLRIGEKIVARGILVEIGDGVGLRITTVY